MILLDAARDRYFAPPRICERDFIEWLSGPPRTAPKSCREALVALKVAHEDQAGDLRPVACSVRMPAPLDPEPLAPVAVSATDFFKLAGILFITWRQVRSRRLQLALDRAFSNRPSEGGSAQTELTAKLAAFRSARPFIPIPRVCLHDSIALVRWLGPSAGGVELVMGVSAYPFSAHCWVQAGGRVIDDHPQSPSRFHPILRLP
jgi:hypothetical protein